MFYSSSYTSYYFCSSKNTVQTFLQIMSRIHAKLLLIDLFDQLTNEMNFQYKKLIKVVHLSLKQKRFCILIKQVSKC